MVTRRQQSRAEAKRRELCVQALGLRASGATYRQIAEALGIDKMTAWRLVQEESQQLIRESAREALELELLRLDRLLMAVWADAIQGDHAAIASALKISDMRCRLLGLYDNAPEPDQLPSEGVIIIRGETQEEYIRGLQAMRGISPPPSSNGNGHREVNS